MNTSPSKEQTMTRVTCFLSGLLLAAATTAFAQEFPEIRPLNGEKLGAVASFQREYERIKINMTEEAERMPEEFYPFTPGPIMRSYGELMGHITNSQFSICAVLRGVPNPNQGVDNEDYKSKAQAKKALAASFAFCDPAFSSLTEKSLMGYVKEKDGELTRAGSIAHFFAHGNDVYGYAAVYMRLKGIAPPTTERGMVGRFGPAAAESSPK
jgi:uncharacterized damage-inducible protein DinB